MLSKHEHALLLKEFIEDLDQLYLQLENIEQEFKNIGVLPSEASKLKQ